MRKHCEALRGQTMGPCVPSTAPHSLGTPFLNSSSLLQGCSSRPRHGVNSVRTIPHLRHCQACHGDLPTPLWPRSGCGQLLGGDGHPLLPQSGLLELVSREASGESWRASIPLKLLLGALGEAQGTKPPLLERHPQKQPCWGWARAGRLGATRVGCPMFWGADPSRQTPHAPQCWGWWETL